jgi:hypothetical protein
MLESLRAEFEERKELSRKTKKKIKKQERNKLKKIK